MFKKPPSPKNVVTFGKDKVVHVIFDNNKVYAVNSKSKFSRLLFFIRTLHRFSFVIGSCCYPIIDIPTQSISECGTITKN